MKTKEITLEDLQDLYSNPEKVLALYLNEGLTTDDLDIVGEDGNTYSIGNKEWLVVDDDEAEDLWSDYLDSYIDECVLPEIPKHFQKFFDTETLKEECKYDGRAHSLARYDGCEDTQTVNGTTYYIYRIN